MPMIDITNDNFDTEIDKYPLCILDFWAEWCEPCKAFLPIFEAAALEHPDILFGRINTETETVLAKQFEVMSIPTLLAAKDGTITQTQIGMVPPTKLASIIKSLRES